MAGRKISSVLLVVVFFSLISFAVSMSPVSSPPYLPAPYPIPYSPESSSPMPADPISYPPEPASPMPADPISYPPEPASPMPADPISYPPEPASPMPADPISYPPEPASPIPAPISYPPEPASPMPAPFSPPPSTPSPMPAPVPPSRRIKGAYWPSFTGFPVSAIDTSYFTHLYYAFLLPDPSTYKLAITPQDEQMLPEFTGTLRTGKLPVKTLLSIGGAGNDPIVISQMVSRNSTRAVFIQSTIEVARRYGFDGVDLDWEFPANQEDMSNLSILYKEWRKALNKEARATGRRRLLLTSAVYFASKFFLANVVYSYPGESIRKYVDWVSPMCFDYHGSWDMVTGQHAALYDPNSDLSTSFGIQSWIDAGVPPNKVVMGLPLYAHTWLLKDPNVHGIGAPAIGVGPGVKGIMIYSEVVDFNSANNATVVYDGSTVSAYSYAGDAWIGYDDPTSVTKKIQFARSLGLGGYFFWALGQDKDWTISRQASSAWEH